MLTSSNPVLIQCEEGVKGDPIVRGGGGKGVKEVKVKVATSSRHGTGNSQGSLSHLSLGTRHYRFTAIQKQEERIEIFSDFENP